MNPFVQRNRNWNDTSQQLLYLIDGTKGTPESVADLKHVAHEMVEDDRQRYARQERWHIGLTLASGVLVGVLVLLALSEL